MPESFDPDAVFDDDYLYFYEPRLAERSDAEAERIWRLLAIEPGMAVGDIPCGHGRIAQRLAARGADVTGVDRSSRFLDVAREASPDVTWVQGDMRATGLPAASLDRVVSWFTSFGYFDDEGNRATLTEARRLLRPGGRLLIETPHLPGLMPVFQPTVAVERDGDWVIDRWEYRPLEGCTVTRRTLVRDGRVRDTGFTVRLYTFTELRDALLAVGFTAVEGLGEDDAQLRADHRRMVVIATTPRSEPQRRNIAWR